MKKKGLAILLALVLCFSTAELAMAESEPPASAAAASIGAATSNIFLDTADHWAKTSIDSAVQQGWFRGTSTTTFLPDASVDRGMFVTVLGRMAGAGATQTQNAFADVAADDYFAPYAAWAYENDITSGTTATTFSPDVALTREQLATMLYQFSKTQNASLPSGTYSSFSDASQISQWAAEAVAALSAIGIMNGKDHDRFDPAGTATRAETATVLVRYWEVLHGTAETPEIPVNDPSSASNISSAAGVPLIILNNGVQIPQLGLGTQIQRLERDSSESGRELLNTTSHDAVVAALQAGYRHLDTAHGYYNEYGVGQGIIDSGVPREEIWVTSKLWTSEFGEGTTMAAIDEMLTRLQLDYLDCIYLHHPAGDYVGAWKDLEKAYRQGKVRALGISNFDNWPEAFEAIIENSEIKPQILQIECHPYAQRKESRELAAQYDIQIECWYPIGHADPALLQNEVLTGIAAAHDKSVVQVILRWHMQEGLCAVPGSTNPDHIQENIDIFDFSLSDEEMDQIRLLDQGDSGRHFNIDYERMGSFFMTHAE